MTERGVHISANNGAVSLAPSSSFRSINGRHGCIRAEDTSEHGKVFACRSHALSWNYNDGNLCYLSLLLAGLFALT